MYKYNYILYWFILDIASIIFLYKYFHLIVRVKKFNIYNIVKFILILFIFGFLTFKLRNHKQRNFIRTNNIIHDHNYNYYPNNFSELIDTINKNKDKKFNIIGSGWSCFLNKKGLDNPIFTDKINRKIRETNNTITYESGTMVKDIQGHLIKNNYTLSEFPSLEWITIGGWIIPGCHGHPGSIKKQLYKSCKIYNIKTNEILTLDYGDSFQYFGKNKKHIILLEVEFIKYKNQIVENNTFNINNINKCNKWLGKNTHGRLIFVGNRGAIGSVWLNPKKDKTDNNDIKTIDKYNSKLFNQWYSLDIETWISSNIMNIDINNTVNRIDKLFKYQTLARSNQTVPGFPPELSSFALALDVYNFEIFTNIYCDSIFLNKLIKSLKQFHIENGGRSEIRLRNDNILMIDWSLSSNEIIRKSFKFMRSIGIENVYIHVGKYIPENIKPCKLIDYKELFVR